MSPSSGTTVALIREIFASARRLASRWTAGRRSSRACRSRQRRRVRWVRTPRPRSSWTGSQAATCRAERPRDSRRCRAVASSPCSSAVAQRCSSVPPSSRSFPIVTSADRLTLERPVALGLRANWRQFWLLVAVNAFVGAMVGLERTVLPLIAEREYGIVSRSAALSFIATFGVVKALTNLLAGRIGDRFGRKHVLVAGWLFGVPVPLLVIWAPSWSWIIAANVLLGVNQGLAWSTTVVMKIDLVGPERRGLAMGLNEFAGYLALALSALGSGLIAERVGLRPEPFYLGIAFVAIGLGLSV